MTPIPAAVQEDIQWQVAQPLEITKTPMKMRKALQWERVAIVAYANEAEPGNRVFIPYFVDNTATLAGFERGGDNEWIPTEPIDRRKTLLEVLTRSDIPFLIAFHETVNNGLTLDQVDAKYKTAKQHPLLIGLVGLSEQGKSQVAGHLGEMGFLTHNLDARNPQEGYAALRQAHPDLHHLPEPYTELDTSCDESPEALKDFLDNLCTKYKEASDKDVPLICDTAGYTKDYLRGYRNPRGMLTNSIETLVLPLIENGTHNTLPANVFLTEQDIELPLGTTSESGLASNFAHMGRDWQRTTNKVTKFEMEYNDWPFKQLLDAYVGNACLKDLLFGRRIWFIKSNESNKERATQIKNFIVKEEKELRFHNLHAREHCIIRSLRNAWGPIDIPKYARID